MLTMRHVFAIALVLVGSTAIKAEERVLFDFEDAAEGKVWTNLEPPDVKQKEPPARAEIVAEHATSGKHSLRITFAGGNWPTLSTTRVPDDWSTWNTFHADVTAGRDCLVGIAVLQEKSKRGGDWDGAVSRWTKTAFLKAGKNHVSASLHPNDYSAIDPKFGKVVRFEIFLYNPRDGES